jgi:hypothetical protein
MIAENGRGREEEMRGMKIQNNLPSNSEKSP